MLPVQKEQQKDKEQPRRAIVDQGWALQPGTMLVTSTGAGGNTVQYRQVTLGQHVVAAPLQVGAAASGTSNQRVTTVTSAQELQRLLVPSSSPATVQLQGVNTATGQRTAQILQSHFVLNSPDLLALQLPLVMDAQSSGMSADVSKVHSYSLASSTTGPSGNPVQKIMIATTGQTLQMKAPGQFRAGIKRSRESLVTSTTTPENDLMTYVTFTRRLLYHKVTENESITSGPKPKRMKIDHNAVTSSDVSIKRKRLHNYVNKDLYWNKILYYHSLLETYYHNYEGYFLNYPTWNSRLVQAVLDFLKSNRVDPADETKVIQQIGTKPYLMSVGNPPLLSQIGSSPELSFLSKSPSSHSLSKSPTGGHKVPSSPSRAKQVCSPLKQSPAKHNISSVYDMQIGSQEEIVERAKQEAFVMQRISELRKEGLWSLKRLPKVAEPPRHKAHWDYLVEEMAWLSTDFNQERKWKKAAAKKCARFIGKHFQEKDIQAERAERDGVVRVRKVASLLAKYVRQFWSNIDKLVEYKQQSVLEEKRKQVLDVHLNYIVDQTEKYSTWLTQGMNQDAEATPGSSRTSSPPPESSSLAHDRMEQDSDDFEPSQSEAEDDEETIREAEEEAEDESEEIKLLQQESEMPLKDLLETLPPQLLDKVGSETEKDNEEDDDFEASDDDLDDDERTFLEQEGKEKDIDHSAEIQDLENENQMSIEELRAKYSGAYASDFEMEISDDEREQSSSESSVAGSDEESSEDENFMDDQSESSLLRTLTDDQLEDDRSAGPSKQFTEIAAAAEMFHPKGNTLSTTQVVTKVPFLLRHELREYQHIGLDWLNAMYDKKLNGILADEMGLGKTIQTISVLAHLACEKGIWGPHLIVVPTSVMLNWEMELKKWCPAFKILTYYGSPKDRKLKRVGWTKPNAFHVCITSYKLVVQDHKSFRRKRWKYLILDEAQHIKNFKSQRWQMLQNFQSSHRLLLTGTPLQNNLMELWSLMHFLMPSIFHSRMDFKEWFANPLTGMIEGAAEFNEDIVRRLHKVMRPFLLRRLKSEVEKQLPKKYEHVVMCRLSKRQRYLYDDFMSQTKTKETLASGNFMSVINILMQLRKVCNHPNMFEERPTVSPFLMEGIRFYTSSLAYSSLDYDPLKHINLSFLSLIFDEMERTMTAFAAHRIKLFQVPPKLIIEIDNLPEPPPPCPIKIRATFNAKAPRPPAPRPIAPNVGIANRLTSVVAPISTPRFMVIASGQTATPRVPMSTTQPEQLTLQFVQPGAGGGAAAGGGVTLQFPTTRIQQLIRGVGANYVIASVANSEQQPSAIAVTTTQTNKITNPSIIQSMISNLNRQAGIANPVQPLHNQAVHNKPVNRVAPLNGHSVPTTLSSTSVNQNHVQNTNKSPVVHSLTKPFSKTDESNRPTDFLTERNDPHPIDPIEEKRARSRKERLLLIATINRRRCNTCPVYGIDLKEEMVVVKNLRHSKGGSPWLGKGYVNCLNAIEAKTNHQMYWDHTSALTDIIKTPELVLNELNEIVNRFVFVVPAVSAPPIDIHVSHPAPWRVNEEMRRCELLQNELSPSVGYLHPLLRGMRTQFPELRLIEYDCGKLQRLSLLLRELKAGGHRVLIFTQMTRMLDILEQFLSYHGHTYLRLDGNTKVEQRQILMERFNADKRIFCFILSTRSGGIGVNLTGADTVVFYDSDWNPTMDAQAQDRCHRIGQTRDVHIYRLVSDRTIEENILRKANQKRLLGDLAIEEGNFTTAFFKQNSIRDLFNINSNENFVQSFMNEKKAQENSQDKASTESSDKFLQSQLEQALGMAEEESDKQAAKTASAEAVAELAEFDETIPIDADSRDGEEKSQVEQEFEKLVSELKPLEKYALKLLESISEPIDLEQIKQAEEQIEARKKDWELDHLKALKQEEIRSGDLDDDPALFCSRDSAGQIFIAEDGKEEMPIWAPPTPPTNENDMYIDHSVAFWYQPTCMHETRLPPIFLKKDAKRHRLDPIISVSSARKQKVRKDDLINVPRSLFDRPSAAILKLRREVKLQKVKSFMLSPPALSGFKPQPGQIVLNKVPDVSIAHYDRPDWLVQEDWCILQVIQDIQGIPLNLTVLMPGQTPNWALCAEAVSYMNVRSFKACRLHYENNIVPREEGRILYDTKKPKKTKGIYKTKNNRPMKTSQLFAQDNNLSVTQILHARVALLSEHRPRQEPWPPTVSPPKGPVRLSPVLSESGINYDNPLSSTQLALLRAERITREKQKQLPQLAAQAVVQAAAHPTNVQVATAQAVETVQVRPQQSMITVTAGTANIIQPHQAQAVIASLAAQQLQQVQLSKTTLQPSVSVALAKSLSGAGIMVNAPTTAALAKALNQATQGVGTAGQNAAIAAALRGQRATVTTGVTPTTINVQDMVGSVATAARAPTTAVVSVSNLQIGTQQRLTPATTTIAAATMSQLTSPAATTQRNIAQLSQLQTLRQQQHALLQSRREQQKQQAQSLKRLQAAAAASGGTPAKIGPAVAQQQRGVPQLKQRQMTEAEMLQLMKRQQLQHKQAAQIATAQLLAQAQLQPQQVSITGAGATLVKTVSAPSLAIPVSAVTMGGVNINVSMPQAKAGGVHQKTTTTITSQQLRQFQLQQLNARKTNSKMTANLTQIAKVPGKAAAVQIVQGAQGVKGLQPAMTVQQIQHVMKQALPQNLPVVVTATPSVAGGKMAVGVSPGTAATAQAQLKGTQLQLQQQAFSLAVRPGQLQIQVQPPLSMQQQTAQVAQARLQPQTVSIGGQPISVQTNSSLIHAATSAVSLQSEQPTTHVVMTTSASTLSIPVQHQATTVQNPSHIQVVQAAIQAAKAAQQKASPYTMRLRNPPK